MRCVQFSHGTRLRGSLLLAAALACFGLAWLALVGAREGDAAWPGGPRLTARQVPELVQPFSPQRLVGELVPDGRDRRVRP
jgi:hypothetical protein